MRFADGLAYSVRVDDSVYFGKMQKRFGGAADKHGDIRAARYAVPRGRGVRAATLYAVLRQLGDN